MTTQYRFNGSSIIGEEQHTLVGLRCEIVRPQNNIMMGYDVIVRLDHTAQDVATWFDWPLDDVMSMFTLDGVEGLCVEAHHSEITEIKAS